MRGFRAWPLAAACLGGVAMPAQAVQVASARQLADLTLEQLSNIEVTSVSGRAAGLQQAAASIHVITAQDIRRSTATSLPEALRLAPNLVVAQTSAGQWAISARGFNDSIANKLLVLVDGRNLYSSLFAGVFWDDNDVVLEDVERIEVISGPGGTLWGANAVNGVINVVTRRASETQGALLSATRSRSGGREVARYGLPLGEAGHARLYALATDRGSTRLPNGTPRADDSSRHQLGFRADWSFGPSSLTLQGDAWRGGDDPANNLAPELHGGNLLARWSGRLADGSSYQVQGWTDLRDRDDGNLFRTRATTWDVQFTHAPIVAAGQLLWGAGARRTRDRNDATALVLFDPAERSLAWSNVFAQYEWHPLRQLQATAGLKLERNSYTGVERLPSLRLAWLHSEDHTTWASASRVVRAPSRIDRDFFFPGRPPFVIAGGPNFRGEKANVLELGHRAQAGSAFSWSATVFRQDFSGLRAGVPGVVPNRVENLVEGTIDGLEAWGQWQARPGWRLSAGYLTLRQDLRLCCNLAPGVTSFPGLGNDPRYQWTLRSSLDFARRGEFDVLVRRVGALPSPVVPAYTAVDARIGWSVTPALRLALLGRNLFDRRHVEFNAPAAASEIERRLLLQATWEL
ncbi:MAG TPA: TonB-dependent receptor [Ramlibacter sp.]|nr:TonB-dependent receptor [Ramlibacter sp.]